MTDHLIALLLVTLVAYVLLGVCALVATRARATDRHDAKRDGL